MNINTILQLLLYFKSVKKTISFEEVFLTDCHPLIYFYYDKNKVIKTISRNTTIKVL